MRLFFATDLHGSDLCFRKCLRTTHSAKNVDVVIVGGDITGKWLVPIIKAAGGTWRSEFGHEVHSFTSETEVRIWERRLADTGAYGWRCSEEDSRRAEHDVEY